jgi:hypothetical protein
VKYQCDKGHTFIFPVVARSGISEWNWIETKSCPFCEPRNENIDEFVEVEADIVSVKSVTLEEVDGWLVKGYKVKELYAKSATLIMVKKPEEKDYVEAAMEMAKQ